MKFRQYYSRAEKIRYYSEKLMRLERDFKKEHDRIHTRLVQLESEEYQDWSSDLEKDIKRARKSTKKRKGA